MTTPATPARVKAVRRLAVKCGMDWTGSETGRLIWGTVEVPVPDGSGYTYPTRVPPEGRSDIPKRSERLTLDEAEATLWKLFPRYAPREAHPLRAKLEKLAAEYGGTAKDWAIMSPKSDPFLMDTDTNHIAGQWLKDMLDSNAIVIIHDRGVHYVLATAGMIKPNGDPYTNTDANWNWLVGVINAARWLGYIDFQQITDHKNAEPVIRIRSTPEPLASITADLDVVVPGAEEVQPTVALDGFTNTQPYRIAIMGEKSSLEPVLGPIADRYNTDLVLFAGDASNTRIAELARAAWWDGRPLVVLYFADCDPWGCKMANAVAWKMLALQAHQFPGLEFRIYRAGLTPDQVREYDLPQSPIEKGKEAEAESWRDATGVDQTEIDAIATLQPELLAQIAEEWIAYFRDDTLDRRVAEARNEWVSAAQVVVDAGIDQAALDSAVEAMEQHRVEVQAILDGQVQPVIAAAEAITLPDLPDIPEATVDLDAQPEALVDTDWEFAAQAQALRDDRDGHGVT